MSDETRNDSESEQDRERERHAQSGEADPRDRDHAAEDVPGEPGAEGGAQSPAADTLPGMPADDDSELGDTDQHSTS